MWLFTSSGFYSIVKDHHSDNHYKVRSRSETDLVNLKNDLDTFRSLTIIKDNEADYRYRLIITKPQLFELLKFLGERLSYGNFKDHVYTLPDQKEKVNYYSDVWRTMYEYQMQKE